MYAIGVSDLVITNATFANNTAGQNGGGVKLLGLNTMEITASSFTGNAAAFQV